MLVLICKKNKDFYGDKSFRKDYKIYCMGMQYINYIKWGFYVFYSKTAGELSGFIQLRGLVMFWVISGVNVLYLVLAIVLNLGFLSLNLYGLDNMLIDGLGGIVSYSVFLALINNLKLEKSIFIKAAILSAFIIIPCVIVAQNIIMKSILVL